MLLDDYINGLKKNIDFSTMSKEDIEKFQQFEKNIKNYCYPTDWKNWLLKNEKQHKVPLAYSKWFSENLDWKFYVFDIKQKKGLNENKMSADGILKENNFYVFEDKTWSKNYFLLKIYLFHLPWT